MFKQLLFEDLLPSCSKLHNPMGRASSLEIIACKYGMSELLEAGASTEISIVFLLQIDFQCVCVW